MKYLSNNCTHIIIIFLMYICLICFDTNFSILEHTLSPVNELTINTVSNAAIRMKIHEISERLISVKLRDLKDVI